MSSEIASTLARRVPRRSSWTLPREPRITLIRLLGPATILGGLMWALVQPYRIAFLHPHEKGFYDFLAQPPLLVGLVGVVFATLIAPGLVEDLERGRRGSPS
jgi:hypothetical protein